MQNTKLNGSDELPIRSFQGDLGSAWKKWAALFSLAALLVGAFSASAATGTPPGCNGSYLGIGLQSTPATVHAGDTIYYDVTVYNLGVPGACAAGNTNPAAATAVHAWVITPDGVTNYITLFQGTLLNPGAQHTYPNAASYVVRNQDMDVNGYLNAKAEDRGIILLANPLYGGGYQVANTLGFAPCIGIAAQCTGGTGEVAHITFTGTITNCGNTPLIDVALTISSDGGSPITVPCTNSLDVGQIATFSGDWIPLKACLPSSAHITVTAIDGADIPATVTASITNNCQNTLNPRIAIEKHCPAQSPAPGQPLNFWGSVVNTGDVTLTNIIVVNNQPTNNAPVYSAVSLAPGASNYFAGSYIAPAACTVADTLTVTAATICGTKLTNFASATCPITTTPLIQIAVNCPVNPAVSGAVLIYRGTVTNTGNITLTNVVVTSDKPNPNTTAYGPITLAPGAGIIFTNPITAPMNTCSVTTTFSGVGQSSCDGTRVTNTVAPTCPITTAPAIAVTLSCPPTNSVTGGQIIYSGSVSNTGNVTLTNVVVTAVPSTNVFTVASLAPGAETNFSVSFTAPSDACSVSSTATATGKDYCSGISVTNSHTAPCTLTTAPQIVVTKACPQQTVVGGALLTYTGTVTNTGNITLTNVVVVNNRPSNNTVVFSQATLAPGAGAAFTGSYPAPQNVCSVTDTIVATGINKCTGLTVSNSITGDCPLSVIPSILVTLSCPGSQSSPGNNITLSGWVINSGAVDLTNVVVTVDTSTNVFTTASLAHGASNAFTASFTTAADACSVSSMAVATGNASCGGAVASNSAPATCTLRTTPRIAVSKLCPPQAIVPGGQLLYTGGVTNTGNITLTNVVVVNNQPVEGTVVVGPISLAPGEGKSFEGSYEAPLDACLVTDTLVATGANKCTGRSVTNTLTSECPITIIPAIVVKLICPPQITPAGGLLEFSGSVSNAGNISLTNILVTDDIVGPAPVFTTDTLAPGASASFSGSFLVPSNICDISSTGITHTATAIGYDVCNLSLVSNNVASTCPVPCGRPCIQIVKTACPTQIKAYEPVIYTYTVTNCGDVTLTGIVVRDDGGTPGVTNDDFIVGTIASLDPQAVAKLTSQVVPVFPGGEMIAVVNGNVVHAGTLNVETLPNGDVKATYKQDFGINDNTYGSGSIGWPALQPHKFNDLVGSDKLEFTFYDRSGYVVMDCIIDTISPAASVTVPGTGQVITYPAGYGTMGPFGAEGSIMAGNPNDIVTFSTSISEDLNNPLNVPNRLPLMLNSPTALVGGNVVVDTIAAPGGWDHINSFTVVVKGSAFGTVGFGSVAIPSQHNSPNKLGGPNNLVTSPATGCVTNIAVASTTYNGIPLTASAWAKVCLPPTCTSCGVSYPFASDNPRTSIVFNESEVLAAFSTNVQTLADSVKLWYTDEHAMLLGSRRTIIKTAGVSVTNDYVLSPLLTNPGGVLNPQAGDPNATDTATRPLSPSLYITDVTGDPADRSGDWQYGGPGYLPNAIFGTWKGATEVIDQTTVPETITVTTDADPAAKNGWNLGAGSDPVPAGTYNLGYGAEARWNLSDLRLNGQPLQAGHTYRFYIMVHDGDQNKVGGDVGQACINVAITEPTPPATNCGCPTCVLGYPFPSANPRTSVVFNESEVLAAFSPTLQTLGDTIKLWYTDEHAMLLGCRQEIVKTSSGTTTNYFPVTPLGSNPGSAINPEVGDLGATDPAGRPLTPSLYITDITADLTDKSGDWLYGGTPSAPNAVFGTWKGASEVINMTNVPATTNITTDADPAVKNGWNLGPGSDTVPAGTYNLGYGAEVRWNINDLRLNGQPLQVGHTYRFYFMVHDGDQNKTGGDVGHACVNVALIDCQGGPTLRRGSVSNCYPTQVAAEAAALGATTVSRLCCPGPLTTSVSTAGTCDATVTVSVTDACSNTVSVVYSTHISSTPPTVTCPQDIVLGCGASTSPTNTGIATATAGCNGNPVVTYSDKATAKGCTGLVGIDRTWKAADMCGTSVSCVQHITFGDTAPPVIVCPPDKTIATTDSSLPANTGTATATDNCGGKPTVTYSDSKAVIDGNIVITRTWSAKDGCGNTNSCAQTISMNSNLPSPWQTQDVGSFKVAGAASWSSNTFAFTVLGEGTDISGSADGFRYVYQSANDDCSLVARVVSVQNTDNSAKAGVMIRDSLSANSKEASVCIQPDGNAVFLYRSATGGSTTKVAKTGQAAPRWVKLERSGNVFTASCSANGVIWSAIGTPQTISMGTAPYIGLAVTSHKSSTLCNAVFDNVTATP